MEQQRGEIHQMQQQEQPLAPLKCPRCDSMDTKFRYFNNNNPKQPRHYCKTCKRQWTVGGHLRDIPIGGTKRTKQTKVSSSICDNAMYRFLHPPGEQIQHSQYTQLPPVEAIVPQHFDTTMIQPPVTNLSEKVSSLNSYIFNDDMSCLDDIQSFMHPDLEYQSLNVGNQLGGGSMDMAFLQENNVDQSIASQHALAPQFPEYLGPYQAHGEANINAGPYNFSNYNSSQSAWHVNSLPTEDIINNYSFSTSNDYLRNTSSANTTDTIMPTTSVNQNQWPNFPSNYGPH